jgi:hypothetical protein
MSNYLESQSDCRLIRLFKNTRFWLDAHGIDDEFTDEHYMIFHGKKETENTYLVLTELSNKIALALYRANLDAKIELTWIWGFNSIRRTEIDDVSPTISLEVLDKDWDKVIGIILEICGDHFENICDRLPSQYKDCFQ